MDTQTLGYQTVDTMRILAEQRGIRVAQLEARVEELTACLRDVDTRIHSLVLDSYLAENEVAEEA